MMTGAHCPPWSPPITERTEDLIARTRSGDPAALDRLLEANLPALRAFIRLRAGAMIRGKESESDLAQSVCREILQDLDDFEFRGETRFRHWLYTTALRKILDRDKYYRRAKRDAARELPTGEAGEAPDRAPLAACYESVFSPSENAIRREEVEALEDAFEKLPDKFRQIITLSRVVGMTHAEIAEQLDTSEAYSRNLLSRALARLARLMRDD